MLENPILSTTERRYHFEPMQPVNRCGCGNVAKYLVYDHGDPHCMSCMHEAVEDFTGVLVRRIR